ALLIGVYINGSTDSIFTTILINLVAFFFTALVCHGELARRRPPARYLTEFYLWMSFGGMIGGISTGLVAPHVFNWVAEDPLLIVRGLLCRPGVFEFGWRRNRVLWFIAAGVVAIAAIALVQSSYPLRSAQVMAFAACTLLLSVVFLRDPLKLAAIAATLLG